MLKILNAALLCATLAAPALAADKGETTRFTQDGRTYEYSITMLGDTKLIKGYEVGSNTPFTLRVANGRVNGVYGASAVKYRVPATEAAAQIASR